VAGASEHQAANAADPFVAAHRAMLADPSLQTHMRPVEPVAPPPQWVFDLIRWIAKVLRPIGRFFAWIDSLLPDWPYARGFFWLTVAVILAGLIWLVYRRVRYGEWRLPRRWIGRSATIDPEEDAWAPEAAPVRAWLAEADALAAQGRFAEAARLLLRRSIDDIASRRPSLVRPALTSRELAGASAIPGAARILFTGIAMLVERSLFGGRPVDDGDWRAARGAYADFALPGAWRA
jgi:hypothetical protein